VSCDKYQIDFASRLCYRSWSVRTSCFRSAFRLTRSDVRVCSHLVPCLSHFSVVFVSLHIVGTKPFTAPRPSPIPLFLALQTRPRSYSVHIEIAKAIASQFGKSIEAMGGVFQPCNSSCPGRDGKGCRGASAEDEEACGLQRYSWQCR